MWVIRGMLGKLDGDALGQAIRNFLSHCSHPVSELPWTHHSEFVDEDPASIGGTKALL
jgi:hypothetical protein